MVALVLQGILVLLVITRLLIKGVEMRGFPKFFGKVPVGTKGQIVIPAEARKAMNIRPGDSVVIISGPPHDSRAINVFPEAEFNKFLKFFDRMSSLKEQFSRQAKG